MQAHWEMANISLHAPLWGLKSVKMFWKCKQKVTHIQAAFVVVFPGWLEVIQAILIDLNKWNG